MKSDKNPILQVSNLTTSFLSEGELFTAVDSISFDLFPNETLGIVGESGSGKSVTSLSVMRLIPNPPGRITSGEILFGTDRPVNLLSIPEKEMQKVRGGKIAMIFQEPMTSLNPVFTCGNQVAEAIILHQRATKKEARLRTLELFKEVQLPRPEKIFEAYPHQLSGGQKQRVMIAMAVSCQPQVLIADEPTTALDVTVQRNILSLIKRIQQERGVSVIFITHDLGIVGEICDRVLIMYKGKIVEEGPVSEIFSKPQHPYTKGLLACRPPLRQKLMKLPVLQDFTSREPNSDLIISTYVRSLVVSDNEVVRKRDLIYSGSPILDVKNLKTWFPIRHGVFGRTKEQVKAVDDVSFQVYKGEVVGVVGESGSGKTTLGRTILRLINPTAGSIYYSGTALLGLDDTGMRKMRKRLQIIFQDPYSSLNPRMTIGSAILEPMIVHNLHDKNSERQKKVLNLLDRVGLPASAYGKYPHEFSGGQRQRISIARALAVEPEFIVCDESVSALDVSVQAQVLNLLNDLKSEFALSYIFISHDLSVVNFISDRILVMKDGRIIEQGYPEQILKNPVSEYTRNLIEAVPKGI